MWAALRLLFAAALVALPVWLARADTSHACTYSLRDNIRSADLIAIGTVGEMLILRPESVGNPGELGDRTPVEVKFNVGEYIKGSGPATLLVYRPAVAISTDDTGRIVSIRDSNTDCGSIISTGDNYLALFFKSDPYRYGIQQLPLSELSFVNQVLFELSALPITGAAPPAQHFSSPWLVPLVAGGLGVLVSSAFLALSRRRS